MAQNLAESGVGARVWAEQPQLFLLDNAGTVGLFPREDGGMTYTGIDRMVSQQLGDKSSDIAKMWKTLAGYGEQKDSRPVSPYKGRVLYEMITFLLYHGMLPAHDFEFHLPEEGHAGYMNFIGRATDAGRNRGIVDITLRGNCDENFSVARIHFWKMWDQYVKAYELERAERLHASDPKISVFRRESAR